MEELSAGIVIKKKYEKIRTATLQATPLADDFAVALCHRHDAYSFHPDACQVTPSLIQHLKSGGVRIFPYTINDEKRMEQLITWGVSGIISDEPELLWKVIRRLERS